MSQCNLAIHMEPNAKRNEVKGVSNGTLLLKIAVQSDDERNDYGNEELISFLGQILGIANDRISIVQGKNHRIKLLGIDGMDMRQVMEKLKPHLKS
jgi:uncharacterized protein YggU (UPF0235/DUF167 family)